MGIAEDISVGLSKLGLPVRNGPPEPTDTAVIVLLSPELLNTKLETMLAASPSARLVPVTARPIQDAAVPASIATLNWIPWRPLERGSVIRAIALAASTGVSEFNAFESVRARAEGWIAAGRLPRDVVATRRALRALVSAAGSHWGKLPPAVAEFLEASKIATRAGTRSRVISVVNWVVLFSLVAVASLSTWRSVERMLQRSKLDLVANSIVEVPSSSLQIPKYAALILLNQDRKVAQPRALVNQMMQAMATPGAANFFTMSPDGNFVYATAVSDDGTVLWGDGGGSVWRVSARGGTPIRIENHWVGQITALSADDSMTRYAVTDGAHVAVRLPTGERRFSVTNARTLLLSPDGSTIEVETDSATEVWDLAPSTPGSFCLCRLRTFLVAAR